MSVIHHLFESSMFMITDANDLHDDDAKRTETADDIAMRAVTNFYATWKPDGATDLDPHNHEIHGQCDPRSDLYSRHVIGEPTDISNLLRRALSATFTSQALPVDNGPVPPSSGNESRFTEELRARRLEVRTLADKLLGSPRAAQRWLATSFKYQLQGRPIDFMEVCEITGKKQRAAQAKASMHLASFTRPDRMAPSSFCYRM
jgi:hypothetical protein